MAQSLLSLCRGLTLSYHTVGAASTGGAIGVGAGPWLLPEPFQGITDHVPSSH